MDEGFRDEHDGHCNLLLKCFYLLASIFFYRLEFRLTEEFQSVSALAMAEPSNSLPVDSLGDIDDYISVSSLLIIFSFGCYSFFHFLLL